MPLLPLQCKALEEFNIDKLPHPHTSDILEFAERCRLANTLLSMRLQFADGYRPIRTEEIIVSTILSHLPFLCSLTIHGELSDFLVILLGRMTENRSSPILCPLLEKLILGKMRSVDFHYTKLDTNRWNAPRRCIKFMSFVDCRTISIRDSPMCTSRGLTRVIGVDTWVHEGLELDVRFNNTDIVDKYFPALSPLFYTLVVFIFASRRTDRVNYRIDKFDHSLNEHFSVHFCTRRT